MEKKAYILTADMGYGHQRAAFPLLGLGGGESITVNDYEGIEEKERKYWISSLKSYEFISRFKKIPLLGGLVFAIMDEMQEIKPFYPFRNLSPLSLQQRFFLRSIRSGLGKGLITKLSQNPLPIISSFFVATYFTEFYDYPGPVYQIVCDSDASRAWGPIKKDSKTIYLLPNNKLKTRFQMYGVPAKQLVVTGFPLPKTNIGEDQTILKADLMARLERLDPYRRFYAKYKGILIQHGLDYGQSPRTSDPIHIVFAVGGAGAQKELGINLVRKLAKNIQENHVKVTLVAGVRQEVAGYFRQELKGLGLSQSRAINILCESTKAAYFQEFNALIRQADILWTKPSELSFYCALGLPIIMTETIGSQEDFNRQWLLSLGAGLDSLASEYVDEWLKDWLDSGRLAKTALDGFLNAESMGTYNIEKIIK